MKFLESILQQKRLEIAKIEDKEPIAVRKTYSFAQYLRENGSKVQIIGEVKRASPSAGDINIDVDVVEQAKIYEKSGAAAISVLTDEVFFKGNIDDLKSVADAVKIPVLNKDFILDKKQINRAVNAGASIILLIISILRENELKALYDYAKSLGLEILVEVHDLDELRIAEKIGAEIIGVNNRNLETFEIDMALSERLKKMLPDDKLFVSESGISSPEDIIKLREIGADAVLIGEAIMKSSDKKTEISRLRGDNRED